MTITALELVVLLGIILSFFLAALIVGSRSFRTDVHLYFAVTIIALSFCLINSIFAEAVPQNGALELLSWEFLFPFAFLLYVLTAIQHPKRNKWYIWVLGIPFLLFSVFRIVDFFFGLDVYDWLAAGDEQVYENLIEGTASFFVLFALALTGYAYWQVRNAKHLYQKERRWLLMNSIFLLTWLVCWLFSESVVLFLDVPIWDYLLAVLSIFLVVVSYQGVHQLNIAEQRRQIAKITTAKVNSGFSPASQDDLVSPKTSEKIEKLQTLMIERDLYRNPDLTRKIVAVELGISEGYLSELLRKVLQTSFNDYVNRFRVQYAIRMLEDEQFSVFSIEAVGYESGFHARSAFYAAFKKVTQKTPGAYRKALNLS